MIGFKDTNGAVFSDDRVYRYLLWRRWREDAKPPVAFIGLNPSTADESTDDPTIRRCIGFAKSWGFDGMVMVNLFAFRATAPNTMKAAADPVGEANDAAIRRAAAVCGLIVCCWGVHGGYGRRGDGVLGLLRQRHNALFHLGVTKSGQPRHPLYLRADTRPLQWIID